MTANDIGRGDLMGRREATAVMAAAGARLAMGETDTRRAAEAAPLRLTCFIRYQIDPFQRDAFAEYARNWGRIIPQCGGHLLGYFLPAEGTNDVAWGLIAFDSLASYETYRARLRTHADAQANFAAAQSKRFILREERTFVEIVAGTFEVPAQ